MDIEGPGIEVKEGTYDTQATYDRERAQAKQQEIDALVEGGQDDEVEAEEEEEVVEEEMMIEEEEEELVLETEEDEGEEEEELVLETEEEAEDAAKGGENGAASGEVVSQEDIDALIEGN